MTRGRGQELEREIRASEQRALEREAKLLERIELQDRRIAALTDVVLGLVKHDKPAPARARRAA